MNKHANDITVNATVIDEDTMRYGGSEFKRVRTCELEWKDDVFAFVCSECGMMAMTARCYKPKYCPHCGAWAERDA